MCAVSVYPRSTGGGSGVGFGLSARSCRWRSLAKAAKWRQRVETSAGSAGGGSSVCWWRLVLHLSMQIIQQQEEMGGNI